MDRQIKIRGHRIEMDEVEQAMILHDAVHDAAVVVRKQEGHEPEMIGFVAVRGDRSVEKHEASDQVEGWGKPLQKRACTQISIPSNRPLSVATSWSWTSMYDGSQIDKAEMQEWLDDTMRSLLGNRAPGHVLEIGTGTGMILFNLGDGLQSYVGLEPSGSAVAFVTDAVKSIPQLAGQGQGAGRHSDRCVIWKDSVRTW